MYTKALKIAPFFEGLDIYYVRDRFGRTWHTVGKDAVDAKKNIKTGEDTMTFKLYTTTKMGESLPEYNLKGLILDMFDKMRLIHTPEYETVSNWDNKTVLNFMRKSSLEPCDLLLEINKFRSDFHGSCQGSTCQSQLGISK